MYRIVQVVGRDGKSYHMPMTAAQAAFYLRLAEFKAATEPSVTFNDLVLAKKEQELQRKSKHLN